MDDVLVRSLKCVSGCNMYVGFFHRLSNNRDFYIDALEQYYYGFLINSNGYTPCRCATEYLNGTGVFRYILKNAISESCIKRAIAQSRKLNLCLPEKTEKILNKLLDRIAEPVLPYPDDAFAQMMQNAGLTESDSGLESNQSRDSGGRHFPFCLEEISKELALVLPDNDYQVLYTGFNLELLKSFGCGYFA